jgi:hypothetical protein
LRATRSSNHPRRLPGTVRLVREALSRSLTPPFVTLPLSFTASARSPSSPPSDDECSSTNSSRSRAASSCFACRASMAACSFGEVARHDQRRRDQVHLVLLAPDGEVGRLLDLLRLVLDHAARLGCFQPAVGGDEVHVVLHHLGPVVHQPLVDVVAAQSGRSAKRASRSSDSVVDQLAGPVVDLQPAARARAPRANPRTPRHTGWRRPELGVAEDRRLTFAASTRGSL